ncbi:hypothetical protein GCM10027614_82590 [Micromonospora vulcania]
MASAWPFWPRSPTTCCPRSPGPCGTGFGLRLTTESTSIAPLVQGVLDGRYDVGFTRTPLVAGLESRILATEPVCAVLPEGHPLAERAELDLADLADEPWVMTPRSSWEPWHRAYDDLFREAGFVPNIVQEEASVQSLLGLVAAGLGVTRLARSARSLRRTGVVFVPLVGARTNTEMVWLPGNTAPALRRLVDVVTELAAATDLTEAG